MGYYRDKKPWARSPKHLAAMSRQIPRPRSRFLLPNRLLSNNPSSAFLRHLKILSSPLASFTLLL